MMGSRNSRRSHVCTLWALGRECDMDVVWQ